RTVQSGHGVGNHSCSGRTCITTSPSTAPALRSRSRMSIRAPPIAKATISRYGDVRRDRVEYKGHPGARPATDRARMSRGSGVRRGLRGLLEGADLGEGRGVGDVGDRAPGAAVAVVA